MRELLVYGDREFKITIPDDAKITFGPWSPPPSAAQRKSGANWDEGSKRGTLRVYQGTTEAKGNVIAVFSGVSGFRDLTIGYAEKVAVQEGSSLWKSDQHGYMTENKASGKTEWVTQNAIAPPAQPPRRKR